MGPYLRCLATEDIASGMRTAAPTPSSVRAAMRLPALDASAHQSDPAKNTIIHIDVYNDTIGLPQGAVRGDKVRAEAS